MMVNRLVLGLLFLWLSVPLESRGQPTADERKNFARIKASADKGSAEAQFQLGELYAIGDGVKRDLEKAVKWHRKAAEQGLARAQFRLGLDYANGEGVKLDSHEAVHWYQKAADQGFAEAQYELALCFLNGRGVAESGTQALRWLRKAVGQGSAIAEYQIGNCYLQGTGVPKDTEEGVKWIRSAAEKGVPLAQVELGVSYEKGEGVPKDEVQAYKWFALAAAEDDEHNLDIKVRLAKLESKLTKEEVAHAQKLAEEFKPSQSSGSRPPEAPDSAPKPVERADSSKLGHLNIKADVEDCEVFIDGSFVGNSPTTLALPEGAHLIELKKAGYKDYKRELKVLPGSELRIAPRLEKE